MSTSEPIHGVLVVDKPEGPTSHDVVSVARRALGTREIGHTGTLDPMATGVLALVLGHATRLTQFLVGHDKAYDATIRLGLATDTWDRTGTPAPSRGEAGPWPSSEDILAWLQAQLGAHDQLPPPYSAKKIGGVPAHELARKGREVAVKPARVVLHEAELVGIELPLVRVRLKCSAGYYVRALAHTLGQQLGCGACLEALRRTASGEFDLESAVTLADLDQCRDGARARVVPLEALLADLPTVRLNQDGLRRALNGNEVDPRHYDGMYPDGDGRVRLLTPEGRLVAIGNRLSPPGLLHPAVVLK